MEKLKNFVNPNPCCGIDIFNHMLYRLFVLSGVAKFLSKIVKYIQWISEEKMDRFNLYTSMCNPKIRPFFRYSVALGFKDSSVFLPIRFSLQETKTYFFDNFKIQTFLVAHFIVIILLSLFRLVMAKNVNIPIIRSITPL